MSDKNSKRKSNTSENSQKLLQIIKDLERKNKYLEEALKRYETHDLNAEPRVKKGNGAIKEDKTEAKLDRTSNKIHSGHPKFHTSDMAKQKKRFRSSERHVVLTTTQKSVIPTIRLENGMRKVNLNQQVFKEEKPIDDGGNFTEEFPSCEKTQKSAQAPSTIIQVCKENKYYSISLPLWISPCL